MIFRVRILIFLEMHALFLHALFSVGVLYRTLILKFYSHYGGMLLYLLQTYPEVIPYIDVCVQMLERVQGVNGAPPPTVQRQNSASAQPPLQRQNSASAQPPLQRQNSASAQPPLQRMDTQPVTQVCIPCIPL